MNFLQEIKSIWIRADPLLKYGVTFLFWSTFGFWAFSLISQYSVFGYALINEVRLPAEGVSFLGPLGGFFYMLCMSIFLGIAVITNPARRSLLLLRGTLGRPSKFTKLEVYGTLFILSYVTLVSVIYYRLSGPGFLIILLLTPGIFAIVYLIVRAEELFPHTIVRAAVILCVFLACAAWFVWKILNGTILYQVGYGGFKLVQVQTRGNREGECREIYRGNLVIRSREFVLLRNALSTSDVLELPISDLCEIRYSR